VCAVSVPADRLDVCHPGLSELRGGLGEQAEGAEGDTEGESGAVLEKAGEEDPGETGGDLAGDGDR